MKIISKHGVGYDNIDLDTVKNKKITLTITKNANSVSVAEHIFSMILNISKGINAYDKCVKDGNFSKKHELLHTQEISDKKILIVGFGSVTKKLIKRCLGFEMKVYIYDPNANKEIIDSFGCTKIDNLDEGLKEADIVSLNVPLNKNTHNMINMEKIKITYDGDLRTKAIHLRSGSEIATDAPVDNKIGFENLHMYSINILFVISDEDILKTGII